MLDALDFWLGRWTVFDRNGARVGVNHVERVLDGFAILEHWRGVEGGEGKSLFAYDRTAETWRQTWVMQGYVKHKSLTEATPGRVRFEGHALAGAERIPDRTTLAALADGSVSQLIEHSRDGGTTWEVSFDAIYERSA